MDNQGHSSYSINASIWLHGVNSKELTQLDILSNAWYEYVLACV